MGVRKLGNRPWTFTDAFTDDELALKLIQLFSEDVSLKDVGFLLQLMKR